MAKKKQLDLEIVHVKHKMIKNGISYELEIEFNKTLSQVMSVGIKRSKKPIDEAKMIQIFGTNKYMMFIDYALNKAKVKDKKDPFSFAVNS